jgi:nucleotide-binding universal stress UspA family protein
MYRKILIATDGSELAQKGVEHGLALAKMVGAEVIFLTVSEPFHGIGAGAAMVAGSSFDPIPELAEQVRAEATRALTEAEKAAQAQGVQSQSLYLTDTHPADGIIDVAERNGADLIVMASHGRRGFRRLLLGSQTTEVLVRSPVPVLVIK